MDVVDVRQEQTVDSLKGCFLGRLCEDSIDGHVLFGEDSRSRDGTRIAGCNGRLVDSNGEWSGVTSFIPNEVFSATRPQVLRRRGCVLSFLIRRNIRFA